MWSDNTPQDIQDTFRTLEGCGDEIAVATARGMSIAKNRTECGVADSARVRPCQICWQDYRSRKRNSRYCSDTCAHAAKKERARARYHLRAE